MAELPSRLTKWTLPEPATRTRVVVIDDHPVICEALSSCLNQERDMICCGTADSAAEGMHLIEEQHPDVAVVDISLSDTHGLSLVHDIKDRFEEIQVVIYSMGHESAYAERAIRAGARGYVAKGESSQSVIEAIRTVRDGRIYLNRHIASRLLGKMVHGTVSEARAGIEKLTDQELAVFQLLGQSCSADDIADRLGVSRKTVVAYQRRMKAKLGLATQGKLVQYAYGCLQGNQPQNSL